MNWIGGSRNRLKQKYEKRLQKEFFEKKRFEMRHNTVKRKDTKRQSVMGLSQDLLTLNSFMDDAKRHRRKESKIKNVNLEKEVTPSHCRHKSVILPNSPTQTPSLISIMDAQSDREDRVREQSFVQRSFSSTNQLNSLTPKSDAAESEAKRSKNLTSLLEMHNKWVTEDFQKTPLLRYNTTPNTKDITVNTDSHHHDSHHYDSHRHHAHHYSQHHDYHRKIGDRQFYEDDYRSDKQAKKPLGEYKRDRLEKHYKNRSPFIISQDTEYKNENLESASLNRINDKTYHNDSKGRSLSQSYTTPTRKNIENFWSQRYRNDVCNEDRRSFGTPSIKLNENVGGYESFGTLTAKISKHMTQNSLSTPKNVNLDNDNLQTYSIYRHNQRRSEDRTVHEENVPYKKQTPIMQTPVGKNIDTSYIRQCHSSQIVRRGMNMSVDMSGDYKKLRLDTECRENSDRNYYRENFIHHGENVINMSPICPLLPNNATYNNRYERDTNTHRMKNNIYFDSKKFKVTKEDLFKSPVEDKIEYNTMSKDCSWFPNDNVKSHLNYLNGLDNNKIRQDTPRVTNDRHNKICIQNNGDMKTIDEIESLSFSVDCDKYTDLNKSSTQITDSGMGNEMITEAVVESDMSRRQVAKLDHMEVNADRLHYSDVYSTPKMRYHFKTNKTPTSVRFPISKDAYVIPGNSDMENFGIPTNVGESFQNEILLKKHEELNMRDQRFVINELDENMNNFERYGYQDVAEQNKNIRNYHKHSLVENNIAERVVTNVENPQSSCDLFINRSMAGHLHDTNTHNTENEPKDKIIVSDIDGIIDDFGKDVNSEHYCADNVKAIPDTNIPQNSILTQCDIVTPKNQILEKRSSRSTPSFRPNSERQKMESFEIKAPFTVPNFGSIHSEKRYQYTRQRNRSNVNDEHHNLVFNRRNENIKHSAVSQTNNLSNNHLEESVSNDISMISSSEIVPHDTQEKFSTTITQKEADKCRSDPDYNTNTRQNLQENVSPTGAHLTMIVHGDREDISAHVSVGQCVNNATSLIKNHHGNAMSLRTFDEYRHGMKPTLQGNDDDTTYLLNVHSFSPHCDAIQQDTQDIFNEVMQLDENHQKAVSELNPYDTNANDLNMRHINVHQTTVSNKFSNYDENNDQHGQISLESQCDDKVGKDSISDCETKPPQCKDVEYCDTIIYKDTECTEINMDTGNKIYHNEIEVGNDEIEFLARRNCVNYSSGNAQSYRNYIFVGETELKLSHVNNTTYDINTCDINTCDINTCDKSTCDMNTCDINTCDINTCDLNTCDKSTCDMNTCDINTCDINTCDINTCDYTKDVSYIT